MCFYKIITFIFYAPKLASFTSFLPFVQVYSILILLIISTFQIIHYFYLIHQCICFYKIICFTFLLLNLHKLVLFFFIITLIFAFCAAISWFSIIDYISNSHILFFHRRIKLLLQIYKLHIYAFLTSKNVHHLFNWKTDRYIRQYWHYTHSETWGTT